MRNFAVLLVSLLTGTACVHPESLNAVEPVADRAPDSDERVVVANVKVADDAATTARAPALRASSADHPPPEPVFFRIGAGYGALGQIDLEPCRDRGLDGGYLRMRVTFHRSGGVARATVEGPVQPPPEALACIGERLQAAMVPAFDGGDVTLSKSLFVTPDSRGPAILIQRERAPVDGRHASLSP
ncbi:MAG: hypothetical protein ACLP1X_01095 [Polyangiaceae bacterium]|jgi:hypothetical protein